ncbi:hypothetical protein HAX54_025586 [Datura stramonium]|uniref:Uncharacterized protein n=1 Tax=Datura stramonium TaxID=4076 RepID=A0ABS8V1A4_DATST|nr:hypothetical protein [Datura stramonium]
MIQVLNYDNTPIIYFDEALENHEVDSSSSFLVVTTRNGKVVHAEPHMIVEKEIHDAKNLLPEFNEAPKEISDEATSEKPSKRCQVRVLENAATRRLPFDNEDLIPMTHCVSAVTTGTGVEKKMDLNAFTVPCRVGSYGCSRPLCDNGASIILFLINL